jgi:hypothetical protein
MSASSLAPEDLRDEEKVEVPASDANTMVEKNEAETENEPEHPAEIAEEDQLEANEYPQGLQFFFILLALILSIFMVALDLVCLAPLFDRHMLILRVDHRRNGHPKDHGSISQRFPDRMVWRGLLPDRFFLYTILGQALQVLQPEVDLPGISVHL